MAGSAPAPSAAASRCTPSGPVLEYSTRTRQQRLRRRPQLIAGAAQGHGEARIEHVARLFEDVLKELIRQSHHRWWRGRDDPATSTWATLPWKPTPRMPEPLVQPPADARSRELPPLS